MSTSTVYAEQGTAVQETLSNEATDQLNVAFSVNFNLAISTQNRLPKTRS